MLRIGYLIICEDVILTKNNLMIKNPLSSITPISLPGNYSFKVAFSLHNFEKSNFGKENTIRVTLKGPDNSILVDTDELKMKTDKEGASDNASLEGAEADLSMNNVELFEKGIHKLTLYVNEETKELNIPILVKDKKRD